MACHFGTYKVSCLNASKHRVGKASRRNNSVSGGVPHMNAADSLAVLKRDPRFAVLIDKHGPPDLRPRTNLFQALIRSVIHQQLSGKAAATIYRRFTDLFESKKFPTPAQVCAIPLADLRSAGLSLQKCSYIKDIAEKFLDGTIKPRSLQAKSNEEIIGHLTRVKGIGIWSVHMLLIFTLNRPDVLPTGDLGIRKGFQIVYRLKDLPTPARMEQLATPWRQHASIASWYLWRAADEKKNVLPKRTSRAKS